MTESANIAAHLPAMARQSPNDWALTSHQWDGVSAFTFAQLDSLTDCLARGFSEIGFERGMRVALMVPPGTKFFAITFALFKLGTVPVLIDPGMGIRGIGQCLADAQPEAFIGVTKAHLARILFRWAKKTLRYIVHCGISIGPGWALGDVERLGEIGGPVLADVALNDLAAILFTSGSTGPAKGAEYTHAMFQEQVRVLRETFQIQPGEIDFCTFPLFTLFAPALGMKTVVPQMDATRPAKANPIRLTADMNRFQVTNLFGSPALLNVLSQHASKANITFPEIRRVLSAGAPVSAAIIERTTKMLSPGAQVFTPYGATEALPVSVIGSDEILNETRAKTDHGAGICVGRPVGKIEVAIIEIDDEPIRDWSQVKLLPTNQIGEITVRGPVVSPSYVNRPDATALHKISDSTSGTFWHRMGDVGYLDETGRLWFCGRKAHRVITTKETLFTIPCEAVFNTHPAVFRSALVSVAERPVLCVELETDEKKHNRPQLIHELLAIGERFEHTQTIREILIHPKFPVDIRHNAKINREKLAVWAARKLR